MRPIITTLALALALAPAAAAKSKDLTSTLGLSSLVSGTPEAFATACKSDIEKTKAGIAQFKATKTGSSAQRLEQLDVAFLALSNAGARAGLARETNPNEAMRKAAEQCTLEVSAAYTEISLDRGIYDSLAALDLKSLDPDAQYYVTQSLAQLKRAGVDRDEPTRAKVKALREELTKIGQEFNKNIAQDVRTLELDPADLDGLPEDFRKARPAGANGKVTLKTDNTDYVPFMTFAKSSAAREKFWRLYRQRAYPANIAVLQKMMEKRHELATLLGYRNWAQYITEDKMIGNDQNIADFIEKIASASDARAKRDYNELLLRAKQDNPQITKVNSWDAGYLSELVKKEKYSFDSSSVRPYFEYHRVKQGLFDLTSQMFGISYRKVTDAKVWHPDVEAYDMIEKGRVLGRIYLDMFPRENKFKHYANFGLSEGKQGVALPESVLVCNFPKSTAAEPGLMLHGDVVTFFHEFGHLIASVFSGSPRWNGPGVQWDFVEAPSQMLEEWVWDPAVLARFAKHYQTGEPISAETVKKMKRADNFGRGMGVRTQMFYAATSLNYYNRDPKGVDTTALMAELQSKYTPFPYVEGTYFHTAFGHLNGYSAIYYTYMWSLVIAKDLFTVFKQDGLLNTAAAQRYRKHILEPINSKPSAKLVETFLNRPYNFKAYEDWLNESGE